MPVARSNAKLHAVARSKVAARSVQHRMQAPPAAGLTRAPVKSALACRCKCMLSAVRCRIHACDMQVLQAAEQHTLASGQF